MHELRREQPEEPERVKTGYVGGGSRSWAATLMNDLAQCTEPAGEVALYDVDHESARENAELGEVVQSREEAVGDWMRALRGIEPLKSHANVPNEGQCPDLPEGAVVETNVLVDGSGITPQTAGPFPPELRSIRTTHVTNQETIVETGIEGGVDRAYRASSTIPS